MNNKYARETAAAIKNFVTVPTVNMNRSKFFAPYNVKTTFNAGLLVPIGKPMEVLPGDTVKVDIAAVVRTSTPIANPMDTAKLVVSAVFVPDRLVMDK